MRAAVCRAARRAANANGQDFGGVLRIGVEEIIGRQSGVVDGDARFGVVVIDGDARTDADIAANGEYVCGRYEVFGGVGFERNRIGVNRGMKCRRPY